jgi:glyoxylase-like metal-dependent hydrolase (beta-lactamase superfamily II)
VRIIPIPGHTEAHCGVMLESAGERALYLGDIGQHSAHLERYPWISSFDVLPLVSLETKKQILGKALDEKTMLIAAHQPYPGVGYIVQEGKFRRWELIQPVNP